MTDPTRWARIHKDKAAARKARKRARNSPGTPQRRGVVATPERGFTLGPLDLSDDLVTVSVPTWKTPVKLLERAIASVLDGKHRNVRVVCISDGEQRPGWADLSPELHKDPRLICIASPKNMGPYFNHDVVLRAASGPWFAVQDSDDESHEDRFRLQLTTMHHQRAEAVHSPIIQVDGTERRTLRGSARTSPEFSHHANHFGLYSVGALLALGGYHGGFRVGYDTIVTSYLNLLTSVYMTQSPLYTRYARAGSLTDDAATGHRSKARQETRRSLRQLWDTVFVASEKSQREGANAAKRVATERARKYGDVALRDKLVAEVKAHLGRVGSGIETPRLHGGALARVVAAARGSEWSISADLATKLYRHCETTAPKIILDVGSGASTAVLALYAARYGARVVSLEHDRKWHQQTGEVLRRMGLRDHVELVHAPLGTHDGSLWYDARLGPFLGDAKIDLVFVDGPPAQEGSRGGAMKRIRRFLRPGTAVWLHDGKRPEERAVVEAWKKLVKVTSCELDTKADPRGTFMLEVTP